MACVNKSYIRCHVDVTREDLFSAPRRFSAIADKPAVSSRTRRHHATSGAAAACDTYYLRGVRRCACYMCTCVCGSVCMYIIMRRWRLMKTTCMMHACALRICDAPRRISRAMLILLLLSAGCNNMPRAAAVVDDVRACIIGDARCQSIAHNTYRDIRMYIVPYPATRRGAS